MRASLYGWILKKTIRGTDWERKWLVQPHRVHWREESLIPRNMQHQRRLETMRSPFWSVLEVSRKSWLRYLMKILIGLRTKENYWIREWRRKWQVYNIHGSENTFVISVTKLLAQRFGWLGEIEKIVSIRDCIADLGPSFSSELLVLYLGRIVLSSCRRVRVGVLVGFGKVDARMSGIGDEWRDVGKTRITRGSRRLILVI